MINSSPPRSPCGSDNCRTSGATGLDQGPWGGHWPCSHGFGELAESLAGIAGNASLELLAQAGVIKTFADQYELVFARAAPIAVIEGETLAGEVKNMTELALVEPENSLGTENGGG